MPTVIAEGGPLRQTRTWKVDAPLRRFLGPAWVVVVVAVLVLLIGSIAAGSDVSWQPAVGVLLGLPAAVVLWRQSSARTTFTAIGVEVYDGFRTRRVPWSDVLAVGRHTRYREIVSLRLTGGEDFVLLGVRGGDFEEVQLAVEEQT